MANLNITGKILKIGKLQEVGEKKFKKRAVLIEESTKGKDGKIFTNPIFSELTQDKCALLDSFKIGDTVTVSINIKCNEYEGKYFTNLQAFNIKAESASESSIGKAQESEDLPF